MSTVSGFEPKLALFDFDGTLVHHCYEPFFEQVAHFLAARGIHGVTYQQLWEDHHHHRFLSCIAEHERSKAIREFLHEMDEQKLPRPALIADTRAALAELHRAGIKIAIVTARLATEEDLKLMVGDLGILDYISHLSTRGPSQPEWKDKAQQIHKVCAYFNISAAKAFMVGDMPVDITSAHAAQVGKAIGVLSGGVNRAVLEACNPHHVLEHVGEVPPVIVSDKSPRQ